MEAYLNPKSFEPEGADEAEEESDGKSEILKVIQSQVTEAIHLRKRGKTEVRMNLKITSSSMASNTDYCVFVWFFLLLLLFFFFWFISTANKSWSATHA